MTVLPDSFIKVNYPLRPSKQVERKLLVEILHHLGATLRYSIREYTYLGFGSVYYTDFVLFHKYLYIDKMICIEGSDIPRRMQFNRPFDFIDLKMSRFSDVLPGLSRDKRFFMWLDYDTGISSEHLQDVAGAIHVLAPGSFFVVTVDAEPRIPDVLRDSTIPRDLQQDKAVEQLRDVCGSLYPETLGRKHYTAGSLPSVLATVLANQMREAAWNREDVEFAQLVNFRYKDGAQMVSLGGVVDSPKRIEELRDSSTMDLPFVNQGPEPQTISVPHLTIREKLWLEQNPDDPAQFELADGMQESFRKYRRYYPSYHEALL